MILGHIHLILLFDTELQNSSKQIWTILVETKYPSFIHLPNFVFERVNHFVNHFLFWRYVIQQPLTKIFNLLHFLSKEIFLIFCLSFVVTFDGLQHVGYKTGVGSFEFDSPKMILVCSTNLTASNACINSTFVSL